MEMLQHLNFDKDIFIPKHIIESNKKNPINYHASVMIYE